MKFNCLQKKEIPTEDFHIQLIDRILWSGYRLIRNAKISSSAVRCLSTSTPNGHVPSINAAMDCLASHMPQSLRSLVEMYAPPGSEEYVPYIGVSLASLLAVYVGYLYILSRKEAGVNFNVPTPLEVRNRGSSKTWEDIQGQQKMLLQDQVRGVSISLSRFLVLSIS